MRATLVASAAQEHINLRLDRGLNDQSGTKARDVLDDLGHLSRAVEQGIDLATNPVGG
jgi:hypothetical protein